MRQFLFPDKSPFMRLGFTVVLSLTCFLLVYLIASPVATFFFGAAVNSSENLSKVSDPANLGILRFYQIVLSVGFFLLPPLILAWLFSGRIWGYLYLNRFSKVDRYALVLFMMLVAIPLINFLAYLNEHIQLPGALSGIEAYFVKNEKAAEAQTYAFLNVHTLAGLLFNVFMVALLPAIAEEFMFRGILQRLFTGITKNAHWGILISSFLFSAIHLQFYGFFPRWLLGALFGYLLLWSGSLWLPIFAHFINNAVAVVGYYFSASNGNPKDVTEIGAGPQMLPTAVISLLMLVSALYMLYRRKENFYSITD
jgi:hypothetical protein